MTREEGKMKTFDVLHFVADNAGLSIFEAIEKAYNMGASEQEPVLDKIRAEIEQIEINGYIRDVECFRAGINTALSVINKHIESEDKE